ncbi:branched-chain amino acid ABC transporter permease [Ferruginivarius sediminum]|uniref:Branched-chain amino acid ABC transporter permease n=1 Tax=Ferruginivarius sediminum TaxID=2661937 RepID=A0A369T823_9PROT|nr:branched-chain amino acid ABC transporter permease [Ferruginivarius sediminum]RDD60327.1 branched-chain amino acid ABC transporter permease [Ferruginivarius sediminum]
MDNGLPRLILAAILAAALLALPALVEAAGRGYWTGIATHVLIFALAAGSLNLILGFGGMVSFGHAAFLGTGAYVVGILSHHASMGIPIATWPFAIAGTESALIAWPLAMLAAGALAFVIGLISLRTGGLYFIMITLAFAQMVYFFFVSLEPYGGDDGLSMWSRSRLPGLDLGSDTQFYYVVLALVALAYFLKSRVIHSRFGVVLRGSRDNDRRMRAIGHPTRRYRLAAFTLAGAVAGLAGALIANQTEFVSPAFLHWTRSGEMLVMVILGGIGTVLGPALGATAFLLLEEVFSGWTEHWMIVLGPLLLAVVLFAKRGLWGLVSRPGEVPRD